MKWGALSDGTFGQAGVGDLRGRGGHRPDMRKGGGDALSGGLGRDRCGAIRRGDGAFATFGPTDREGLRIVDVGDPDAALDGPAPAGRPGVRAPHAGQA